MRKCAVTSLLCGNSGAVAGSRNIDHPVSALRQHAAVGDQAIDALARLVYVGSFIVMSGEDRFPPEEYREAGEGGEFIGCAKRRYAWIPAAASTAYRPLPRFGLTSRTVTADPTNSALRGPNHRSHYG